MMDELRFARGARVLAIAGILWSMGTRLISQTVPTPVAGVPSPVCVLPGTEAAGLVDLAAIDPVIRRVYDLLWLPPSDWPPVELFPRGRFPDQEAQAAFRIRRGDCVNPVIYVNPRHLFYTEAAEAGADLYPIYRLASVLIHEMQHGSVEHSEAAALRAQIGYLRRALLHITPGRKPSALGYLQALEGQVDRLTEARRH